MTTTTRMAALTRQVEEIGTIARENQRVLDLQFWRIADIQA